MAILHYNGIFSLKRFFYNSHNIQNYYFYTEYWVTIVSPETSVIVVYTVYMQNMRRSVFGTVVCQCNINPYSILKPRGGPLILD